MIDEKTPRTLGLKDIIVKLYNQNNQYDASKQLTNADYDPSATDATYDENSKLRTEIDYINDIIWNMIQYDANGNILKEFHNGKGIRSEREAARGGRVPEL